MSSPPTNTTPYDEKGGILEDGIDERSWVWEGTCFHPAVESEQNQERALDAGGGGSCLGLNEVMGLIAVGCEDGTTSVYQLFPTKPGQPIAAMPAAPLETHAPGRPVLSHVLSLRKSLNTTASGLGTGRVTCLSWTSDGYCLGQGWELGWSVWSVYGRLGSWSVAGSLASGYGVEGEKSDAFEDHFMHGVRGLVSRLVSLALPVSTMLTISEVATAVLESRQPGTVRTVSAASTPETQT